MRNWDHTIQVVGSTYLVASYHGLRTLDSTVVSAYCTEILTHQMWEAHGWLFVRHASILRRQTQRVNSNYAEERSVNVTKFQRNEVSVSVKKYGAATHPEASHHSKFLLDFILAHIPCQANLSLMGLSSKGCHCILPIVQTVRGVEVIITIRRCSKMIIQEDEMITSEEHLKRVSLKPVIWQPGPCAFNYRG